MFIFQEKGKKQANDEILLGLRWSGMSILPG